MLYFLNFYIKFCLINKNNVDGADFPKVYVLVFACKFRFIYLLTTELYRAEVPLTGLKVHLLTN